jgi:hypothetical protein
MQVSPFSAAGGSATARALILFVLSLSSIGCGGGSAEEVSGLTPRFVASGTAAGPDVVRLAKGRSAGQQLTVDVAIGGPTTSDDLYAFAFDLVIGDTEVLSFVPGSETLGEALDVDGCPDGAIVLASAPGNRVVVSVSKLGGCAGNGIPSGERAIVRLTFRVLQEGTSTLGLGGPVRTGREPAVEGTAYDSKLLRVESVQFDAEPATIQAN